jgi:type III secretion system low calcium response chaperone LcrH/SycD
MADQDYLESPLVMDQVLEFLEHGGSFGDIKGYDEKDYELLYSIGHQYYSQGKFLEAMNVFGHLVAHNHLERKYHYALASSFQMVGDYNGALKFYRIAFEIDPRDSSPTFHAAECLISLGRKEEAAEGLAILADSIAKTDLDKELQTKARALLEILRSAPKKA